MMSSIIFLAIGIGIIVGALFLGITIAMLIHFPGSSGLSGTD